MAGDWHGERCVLSVAAASWWARAARRVLHSGSRTPASAQVGGTSRQRARRGRGGAGTDAMYLPCTCHVPAGGPAYVAKERSASLCKRAARAGRSILDSTSSRAYLPAGQSRLRAHTIRCYTVALPSTPTVRKISRAPLLAPVPLPRPARPPSLSSPVLVATARPASLPVHRAHHRCRCRRSPSSPLAASENGASEVRRNTAQEPPAVGPPDTHEAANTHRARERKKNHSHPEHTPRKETGMPD